MSLLTATIKAFVGRKTTFRMAIMERLNATQPELNAAGAHLLQAAGKGIRPKCVQLVGEACHPKRRASERHAALAEAIELLHTGSLIHDDILDEADTRRGVPAVHVKWDAKVAVLAGDYLLARASARIADLDDVYLSRRMSEVIVALCEGELMQDEQIGDLEVTLEAYLERVAKKTAAPFELACEGAARISGAGPAVADAARRLGFHLGRLFQLVDDLLDWSGDAASLGKPVGQDLLAGSITLPVLVALRQAETGPALRALLAAAPPAMTPEILALVQAPAAKAETLAIVETEAALAAAALGELPLSPARQEMERLMGKLLEQARTHAEARG